MKTSKAGIKAEYGGALQSFLEFVLGEYVRQGDEELWPDKLGSLIALKYGTAKQAAKSLGGGTAIRDAFIGFQHHLYEG